VSMSRSRAPRLLAAAAVAMALVASACGSNSTDKKTASSGSTTGFPVTVKTANGDVAIPKRPTRIVSLSATGTEMLYAVGAGKQVVAVDDTSDYPPGVPKTALNALNPNIEAIAGYQPDLVVTAEDTGGIVDNLKRLSVPVLLEPAAKTFDDTYTQLDQLGRATGHAAAATSTAQRIRDKVSDLKSQVPKRSTPLSYYHELDNTEFTVTSDTFIGEVYKVAGLRDIADATADKAGGYPQLSAEFILQAKPDLVFLADTKCCGQTPATVAARPGWADLPAVKNGHVVPLDDDITSRWGPRFTVFLQTVIDTVKKVGGGSG
jgi:iron complex transport system substrate-binding protein